MAKGENMFCYPENIAGQLKRLFVWLKDQRFLRGIGTTDFSTEAAHFLAELNAIHAFREGNGRTQLAFLTLLAAQAGHPLDFERLDPEAFLAAMIASFHGDEGRLARHLHEMIARY
jgi:cell filamentation protein